MMKEIYGITEKKRQAMPVMLKIDALTLFFKRL